LFGIFPGIANILPDSISSFKDLFQNINQPLSFSGIHDSQIPAWLQGALEQDREALLRKDAFRTVVFIVLSAGVIWGFTQKIISTKISIIAIGLLILIDLWGVDKRYLNDDNFISKRKEREQFTPSVADKSILKDNNQNFRVLNISVSTFNDATTSYFHKSIGGYHGAKLRRYQELIERHISGEMRGVSQKLQKVKSSAGVDSVFIDAPVLNMLNTKYLIFNPKASALPNRRTLGNAWLVDNYKVVENADQEIAALSGFDPSKEAIVDKRFADIVDEVPLSTAPGSSISLKSYEPNHLVYKYKGEGNKLAVFSEIYYPKGWNAYINGELTPHFRVNYVLRAMILKEGEYDIEFKFEPKSYFIGNTIALTCSVILLLLIAGLIYKRVVDVRDKKIELKSEDK
jgi:uncharacterized membrane protein YfhO